MELPADAVAAEFAHDREAVAFGVVLDGCADVAQVRSRPDRANALPHCLVGDLAQASSLDRRRTDVEHAARVAVETILNDGDVDVDDVAGLELLVAGDAVAHDVVHRRADRCRIRLVARRGVIEGRGNRTLDLDHVFVAQPVELAGGHAGGDERRNVVEDFGGERTRDAHFGHIFGGLE